MHNHTYPCLFPGCFSTYCLYILFDLTDKLTYPFRYRINKYIPQRVSEKIMKRILDEDLAYEILSVVEEIPEGKVSTYGQIAKLIGRSRNARLVGLVLSRSQYYGDYPCHRVVNCNGRTVPGWDDQKRLLAEEGVSMKDDFHVNLKRHLWNC